MKPRRSSSKPSQLGPTATTFPNKSAITFALLAAITPAAMAQQCIPLRGSTACPAFNSSSVSTDNNLRGLFPFLAFVSDVNTFDAQFRQYIATGYSQQKYQSLLGCGSVNLTNTINIYARYTATFLCNALVQNSITPCGLTGIQARPICADTCAAFATSEAAITATPDLCGTNSQNAINLIRADFTNCALPPDSLSSNCIPGVQNEPTNCGFNANLPSLCSYCSKSSPNSTDSCCIFSGAETRCVGVKLPITTAIGTLFPTATGKSNSTMPVGAKSGLGSGQIAGIVVGSILGALFLLAIIIGACLLLRKRSQSKSSNSIFNQPSPSRAAPAMAYSSPKRAAEPDLPRGARVHHMAALEGSSSNGDHNSPIAGGGYLASSSGYDDTPESQRTGLGVAGAPKRGGSLSRHSDQDNSSSPNYGSSPEGMASGQSEQMSHFKDYYSTDDIRTGDLVATLWAYQPRAGDEWDLERGDMLKVVGIWDDGWATGYKLRDKAEDWETRRSANRDSGVSNGSTRQALISPMSPGPEGDGDIKAFPLVCVCLPQHWRKTIEGDTVDPTDPGASGGPPSGSP